MTRGPKATSPRRHKQQPTLPAGALEPPAWLSADGKAEWERIAPELRKAGLLTTADVAALAAYCESFAELQALTVQINAAKPSDRPALYQARSSTINRLGALGRALGLSPRARNNLSGQKTPPPPPADGQPGFEAFIPNA